MKNEGSSGKGGGAISSVTSVIYFPFGISCYFLGALHISSNRQGRWEGKATAGSLRTVNARKGGATGAAPSALASVPRPPLPPSPSPLPLPPQSTVRKIENSDPLLPLPSGSFSSIFFCQCHISSCFGACRRGDKPDPFLSSLFLFFLSSSLLGLRATGEGPSLPLREKVTLLDFLLRFYW